MFASQILPSGIEAQPRPLIRTHENFNHVARPCSLAWCPRPGRVAATPTLGISRRAAEAPGLTAPGLCGIPSCLSLLRKAALKACKESCDSQSLWDHDVTPSLMSTSQQDTSSAGENASTPRGFEPLRAEPNGFRVHLLSRSDTVSLMRSRI